MKKTFLTILLVPMTLLCTAEELSFNLAVLKKGAKTERSVWLHNNTGNDICITEVSTGCVCTKASWEQKPVSPGDSTMVTLRFDAKDRGVFYKTVQIKTSDSCCDMTVILRGRVE